MNLRDTTTSFHVIDLRDPKVALEAAVNAARTLPATSRSARRPVRRYGLCSGGHDNHRNLENGTMKSNSWIVVCRNTGKPVLETFNPDVVRKVNTRKYRVWDAYEWLANFNRRVAAAGGVQP